VKGFATMYPWWVYKYSPGHRADRWCLRGQILLCLEGELHTELEDGRTFVPTPGMSYQVGDQAEAQRSLTALGAALHRRLTGRTSRALEPEV